MANGALLLNHGDCHRVVLRVVGPIVRRRPRQVRDTFLAQCSSGDDGHMAARTLIRIGKVCWRDVRVTRQAVLRDRSRDHHEGAASRRIANSAIEVATLTARRVARRHRRRMGAV
jgi:hypothetical protein